MDKDGIETERPWGKYKILSVGERFKIKLVEVFPHHRLSLQRHKHRTEHWIIIQGVAKITIEGKVFIKKENETAYINLGDIHRLENPTDLPLKIVEIQCGKILDEGDIERLEDDYKR